MMTPRVQPRLPHDLAGKLIGGRYELQRQLAYGGMGAVYVGRNTATLKRCAIKLLLSTEVEPDSPQLKRFILESRSSAVVESDHIVSVFDAGIDEQLGIPYIVMELLRGEDLRQLLKRLQVLPPELVARLALQAATGLAKAHAAGVVHRDIKPANLYLTQRDNGEHLLKIVDFGIAKVRTGGAFESQETLTQGGHVLGTPAYMSPEQARGERDAGTDADVWSLGVVMFELLVGRLPYRHTTPLATLMTAIVSERIPSLLEVAPWVPAELSQIVERATSRDVRMRYRDALEFHEALATFCGDDTRITRSLLRGLTEDERKVPVSGAPVTLAKPFLGDDARVTQDLAVEPEAPARPRRRWLAAVATLVAAAGAAWAASSLVARYVTEPRASASAAPSPVEPVLVLPTEPVPPKPADPIHAIVPAPSRALGVASSAAPAPRVPAAAAATRALATRVGPATPDPTPAPSTPPVVRKRAQLTDAVDEFR